MTPHTCPNCQGVGERRYYGEGGISTAMPMLESCRSCQGTGVVWGPPATYQPFYDDYQPPFVTTWSGSDYNMVH